MDYYSGKVLEEKNKDLVRSVASISKLMTAYVTLSYCNSVNDIVVIGDEIDKSYGSTVYLSKKDISFFVSMMNNYARKLGNFVGSPFLLFLFLIIKLIYLKNKNFMIKLFI